MTTIARKRKWTNPNPRANPAIQRALDLLADGEWHSYREVISKVAATVPPGIATRRGEYARQETARRKRYVTVEERRIPIDATELVRVGSLIIARQVVQNKRLFEIDPPGALGRADRRVRLRPQEEER